MIAWLWLTALAFAADMPWAGIPTDRLPGVGLNPPWPDENASWQAPIEAGGWVRLAWFATVEEADRAFDGLRETSSSMPATDLVLPNTDEAAGDGVAYAIWRSRNVVVTVRSDGVDVGALSARLREGLVVTAPPGQFLLQGISVDACGLQKKQRPPE